MLILSLLPINTGIYVYLQLNFMFLQSSRKKPVDGGLYSSVPVITKAWQLFCSSQVLCPRCEVGNVGSPKRKPKKGKESPKSNKKKTPRLNTLSEVEKALSETKDSTSAVSVVFLRVAYKDNVLGTVGLSGDGLTESV